MSATVNQILEKNEYFMRGELYCYTVGIGSKEKRIRAMKQINTKAVEMASQMYLYDFITNDEYAYCLEKLVDIYSEYMGYMNK